MLITFSKNRREVLEIIEKDINGNKKYVKSGYTIGGEITGNKVQLQLNDDYGKHSSFMEQVFYGTVIENSSGCEIKGYFRIKTMALVLLLVLLAFAVESSVASLVLKGFSTDLFLPLLVIAAEVFYFIYIKRSSFESNKLIEKYLNNIDND